MFREMRRKRQLLSKDDTDQVMKKGTSGVLAVIGDDDYPYAVPLSYVYCDNKIYFHGAKSGHKLDAVMNNPKASFCVIDDDKVVSEEFTTYFRSVIAFGKIRVLKDEAEVRKAIKILAEKYTPDDEEGIQKEIDKDFKILCMMEMKIEHMTGKEAIEIVRAKQKNK